MLGIDVSKATLDATLIHPQTQAVLWRRTVPNTEAGVAQLLRHSPQDAAWVLEPTGRYGLLAVRQAQAAARTVLLAQPKNARNFLAALNPRAKTDRLDSKGLAVYGCCAKLLPYPVKSEEMEQMDQLRAARRGLVQARMQLRQQRQELPHAAALMDPAIASLEEQLAALDAAIAEQTAAHAAMAPLVKALDAVPGIGPVTATALAAVLTSRDFVRADAFVAYVGLDTRVQDSGQKVSHRRLSKRGDAEVRRLLYLAAQANLRVKNSPFKDHYQREREKGLSSTAALCVVARKLARLAWSLARHGTEYDPLKVYQKPEVEQNPDAPSCAQP